MKKKNILIIPYSHQLGSTHCLLEIARLLKKNGFNIFIAGNGYYLRFAKEGGFKIVKLIEIPYDTYRKCTDIGSLDYLTSKEIKRYVEEEVSLIKRLNINLIIDILRPTTYISSRISNIPRIGVTYAILTNYYKPDFSIPESHVLYSTKVFPPLFKILNKFTKQIRKYYYWKYASKYRKYLKELGFKYNIDYTNLIEDDKTFIYDIKELAPIREDTPKKYVYLGPLLYKLPVKNPINLDIIRNKKNKYKLIVVYLSMGSTGELYKNILDDLVEYSNQRKELIIIGSTCIHKVNYNKYKDFKNIYLFKFAPADYIFPLADINITHGGRGTIYHSLKHAVPMIGIPHQLEQEWNNQRLEELKVSINVSKRFYSKEKFFRALDDIISKLDYYKKNCLKLSEIINNFQTEKILINEINKIL